MLRISSRCFLLDVYLLDGLPSLSSRHARFQNFQHNSNAAILVFTIEKRPASTVFQVYPRCLQQKYLQRHWLWTYSSSLKLLSTPVYSRKIAASLPQYRLQSLEIFQRFKVNSVDNALEALRSIRRSRQHHGPRPQRDYPRPK